MQDDEIDEEIMSMSTEEIRQRTRHIEEQSRMFNSDIKRLQHETASQKEAIKENQAKIKLNKQLPYLVGNVIEILDIGDEEDDDDGAVKDVNAGRKGNVAIVCEPPPIISSSGCKF